MKVLHLISSKGLYGAEGVLLNLMIASKNAGHQPHLMCFRSASKPEPQIDSEAKNNGITSRTIVCKYKFDIKAIRDIRRFALDKGIQIIHSHGYKADVYGAIVSKFSHLPLVATLHGWTNEDKKVKFYETIDKLILRMINHLVPVSSVINEELKGRGLNGRKVTVIPNAIDTEKFNPFREDAGPNDRLEAKSELTIGTVGRLSPEKGHSCLLKVFKKVISSVPNLKLLIVGDGALRSSLEKEAKDLGIEKKVIFTGMQKDMVSMYRAMDIFVLPSFTEGLPLVLLEAMSMELPVVATGVGAIPQVIGQNEGIQVPSKDMDALKEAIISLVNDSTARHAMGKAARRKVVSDFSLDQFTQKYMSVYERVLDSS